MRKTTHILLLVVFVCSATVFAAEFKLYPGAKIDKRATSYRQEQEDWAIEMLKMIKKPGLEIPAPNRINIYATSDSFEQVCAFYKRIGREVSVPYNGCDTREVTKTKSGLTVKTTAFTLDRKPDISESNLWVIVQRPYLGECNDDPPDGAKYLDQFYDYIVNATAIILEERIEVRSKKE